MVPEEGGQGGDEKHFRGSPVFRRPKKAMQPARLPMEGRKRLTTLTKIFLVKSTLEDKVVRGLRNRILPAASNSLLSSSP